MACTVCIALPEDTLTDRVWAADTVVLARPDPSAPFVYRVEQILSGSATPAVDLLINSVERDRMATDPHRVALLLHGPDGWQIGGHGGPDLAHLARRMLDHADDWSDAANDPDRTAAFAALHAHPDPVIRRVALSELSRAPYADLRGIEVALDVDWLAARLAEAEWYPWRPILVQLLGLHADPAARALVRSRAFDVAADARAPWLMALVEIDGKAGIGRILATRPQGEAAIAATRALVAHADPGHDLAPDLAAALRTLAAGYPAVAAEAVAGLRALGDWSFGPQVADQLAGGYVAEPGAAFALRIYLLTAQAMHRTAVAQTGPDRR
ncbi:hypothetical protein ACVDG3_21375 [Meridianimarinicoccus sp. RP-17]|uniref:hypothetical protein n=1 Tax=Meridianimarinicoccus zhengii TaxID=2056810 RepID=UPI000DAC4C94|nr:hypothetical protein [Phycocomes zhengii]